jgi:hypothetical protein
VFACELAGVQALFDPQQAGIPQVRPASALKPSNRRVSRAPDVVENPCAESRCAGLNWYPRFRRPVRLAFTS